MITTVADAVNAAFEFGGAAAILSHCLQVLRDRCVRGASAGATAFMSAWGLWNLFYYPHLDQWASFAGGVAIVAANCAWLALMLRYRRN